MTSSGEAVDPGPRPAAGPSPLVRVGVSIAVLVLVYFLGLAGSPADPLLWSSALPPNDGVTLDALREELEEVNKKLLDGHLASLDRENYQAGSRKLHEFVTRFPRFRWVVSGVMIRRAEGLAAGGQFEPATLLARSAVTIAEEDWRAWRALEEVHRRAGNEADARQAREHVEEYRRIHPIPAASDYALGVLVPLVALVVPFFLLPRLLGHDNAAESASGGAVSGAETIVGVAAPDMSDLEAATDDDGQIITRVLNAEGRLEQARFFIETDAWEEVRPIFKAAVKLNPAAGKKIGDLCVEEGRKYYEGGDIPKAQQCFELGVEYDNTNIRAQTYLANCQVKQGDFQAAVQHYLEVCSLDPQGAIGFYNLGICYEKTKQPEQAVKAFEHALRLDEKMGNAHYYLAKIQEGLSQPVRALEHWQAVQRMSPGTPQTERAEQRIQAIQQTMKGRDDG